MSSGWMDKITNDDMMPRDDSCGAFYCPYTNGSECALRSNTTQPQDLCEAIECEQLRFYLKQGLRKRPS